ncbi:chromosome-associated kinesin KIF4-like [Zootermopsis nevadensis]|uniref:chromosome-associated kinesin KIF4-like n=1 Tax=Zootermopsis nevadensis TaxID=136037 RepID=UPI000B8EB636|nr:chromosome-associated kinesin KIF4-like [Zootermopsis nevadensis]
MEKRVTSAADATEWLRKGFSRRATAMNAQSSRSHAIFTVTVQKLPRGNEKPSQPAKFHLVDLAGSEAFAHTEVSDQIREEGIQINIDLLHLQKVISALATERARGSNAVALPLHHQATTASLLQGWQRTPILGQ